MTPYPNIYSVIPSPATVTVLTGRGMVLEMGTRGIPVVNPRSLDKHTSFEAGVVGLILGAHLLGQEPQLSTVTINTDSQAVLLALDIRMPKPSQ